MRRLAIIDHDTHTLYVEDVTEEMMKKYNDEEQLYINDNYNLENYSWDWIIDTEYISDGSDDMIEVNFKDLN